MNWLLSTALKKGASRLIQYVIVLLTTGKIASILAANGVAINIDPTLATASVLGVYEVIRNFLKVKLGVRFL